MTEYPTYAAINDHLKKFFPSSDIFVFDELVSPDFHLDTYLIKPGEDRGFYTLMTAGVSGNPMQVPDPRIPAHLELFILLPETWKFQDGQWRNQEYFWPIELIKSLGRFPHANNTFLGYGHTIPESKNSFLFAKGFVATILLKSSLVNEEFQRIDYDSGCIDLLMPIPLYKSEYDFKKECGIEWLLEKMIVNGYPDIIDLDRKAMV